jgi:acyl-CoA thioester hydrolase
VSGFAWPTRVYWEDTDGGGVVYYANYLKFLERARTEWLRALGFSQAELAARLNVLFTVVSLHIDYRKAARLDDSLVVTCEPVPEGRATLRFAQQVRRGEELLAEASVRVACVDAAQFRPRRIPDEILRGMG